MLHVLIFVSGLFMGVFIIHVVHIFRDQQSRQVKQDVFDNTLLATLKAGYLLGREDVKWKGTSWRKEFGVDPGEVTKDNLHKHHSGHPRLVLETLGDQNTNSLILALHYDLNKELPRVVRF